MKLIDIEYTEHPFYGTRQMRNVLRRKGYKINRKRVQRLMRKMGIQSIAPKPNTSKAHPQNKVYPYLLRNFDVTRSNQVWSTNITYIPLSGGSIYHHTASQDDADYAQNALI
ncbi:IS3 family transposase [Desulfobacula toluolica]